MVISSMSTASCILSMMSSTAYLHANSSLYTCGLDHVISTDVPKTGIFFGIGIVVCLAWNWKLKRNKLVLVMTQTFFLWTLMSWGRRAHAIFTIKMPNSAVSFIHQFYLIWYLTIKRKFSYFLLSWNNFIAKISGAPKSEKKKKKKEKKSPPFIFILFSSSISNFPPSLLQILLSSPFPFFPLPLFPQCRSAKISWWKATLPPALPPRACYTTGITPIHMVYDVHYSDMINMIKPHTMDDVLRPAKHPKIINFPGLAQIVIKGLL